MSWFDRYVWRRTEQRAALTLEQLLAEESRPTASGEPVTVESALRLSTVWGCVRLLADSVSTLPLAVYRGDDRDPIPTPPLLQRPSADFPELAEWKQRHSGQRDIAVLGDGARFQPVSIAPEESQFIQTQSSAWRPSAGFTASRLK